MEKIVPIRIDEEDHSTLRLKFPPAIRSGNYPIICEGVKKAYGDHVVFHDVNMTIHRGEKVAFVGKNGEGKSTLVKCIMDQIPFEGKLVIGHNVQIGYFAQNQAQLLDENLTVFDTIDRVAQGDIRLKIRDILGAFMFGGEASDKKVKVLSGGERSRLAMIRLLLEEHIGGIYDFLQKKKMESLQELQLTQSSAPVAKEEPVPVSENKLSYEAQKELNRKARKLEKQVAACETHIGELEAQVTEIENRMATPEGAADRSLYEQYQALKKEITAAEEEWESMLMELEELQQ